MGVLLKSRMPLCAASRSEGGKHRAFHADYSLKERWRFASDVTHRAPILFRGRARFLFRKYPFYMSCARKRPLGYPPIIAAGKGNRVKSIASKADIRILQKNCIQSAKNACNRCR